MELNIGTNIRRLRVEKGMTQEQLAQILSVSTAAVSKWEARNTYPDITLLFPLAEVFGVSIDALLGYDEAKVRADIDRILDAYHEKSVNGKYGEANSLLTEARKQYPHDYRLMNAYMWDLAGGSAGNDAETLIGHREELTDLCDCILDGCRQDDLRACAITMKAKLLHASGQTEEALTLLSSLSAWDAQIAKEQLFARDSDEYRYWNKRNCYGLLDVAAIKLARVLRFDPSLSATEKTGRMEAMAAALGEVGRKEDLACFRVAEEAVLAALAGMLTAEGAPVGDILRIREKQFAAMDGMKELAGEDAVLRELIVETYHSTDPARWLVQWLLTSSDPRFAALRADPAYAAMLRKHEKETQD